METRLAPARLVKVLVLLVVIAIALWRVLPGLAEDLGLDLGSGTNVQVGGPQGAWSQTAPQEIDEELFASLEIGEVSDLDTYDRDAFGPAWADVDRNGCDTRNDILARDLDAVEYKPGTHDCTVTEGTLEDPYTGETISFVRGNETSMAVQIDHVIPLGAAWDMGAENWDDATREQFANDPLNLIAVDGPANGSKSDARISEWMPPNEAIHCQYTATYVQIAATYELRIDSADAEVIEDQIATCNAV